MMAAAAADGGKPLARGPVEPSSAAEIGAEIQRLHDSPSRDVGSALISGPD